MHLTVKNRLSFYVYLCCMLVMCYGTCFFYPRWKAEKSEATISWDVSGYYWYLPSVFIYHDLTHQSFKDSIIQKYQPADYEFQQGVLQKNGNYVMKYSSGMAFMYLPFFAVAHLTAGTLGFPRDGFSMPYQVAIQFGGLIVALIGLWHLRKLLLYYYDDKVVAIVMGILVFCTNFLEYSTADSGMSHCWLFTVYVFLLLNTVQFYRSFKVKYAVCIGLLVGLATLTRPTDIISCIIPLLWGMESISPVAFKKQFLLIFKHYKPLLVAFACAIGIVSIQMFYWKYVSGHWIVYSYQDQTLDFITPHFYNYTFSFRSGWLTYCPAMVIAFLGIIPFLKNGTNKVAIILFFVLNYYIVSSWSIWWYGGRAMIQSYPILVFCMASFIQLILRYRALPVLLGAGILVFTYYNSWITFAYHYNDIWDVDFMSKAYYKRVVGRWNEPSKAVMALKDGPYLFEGSPRDTVTIFQKNFQKEQGPFFVDLNDQGKFLRLNQSDQASPVFSFAFTDKTHKWLRAEAILHCGEREQIDWKMAQFAIKLSKNGKTIRENVVRVYRFLHINDTKPVTLDLKLPNENYDSVHLSFWNGFSDKTLWVKEINVTAFNP